MSNCSEIESCFACESCLNDYLRAGLTTRSNFVATLPTGERIELPAGTVLHEATPEDAVRAKLRAARRRLADAGDRRDGDACDAAERDVEQLEKVLANLTERAGLPREMAPPTANGNAETCGAVAGATTCANRQWLAGSRVCSRAPHVGGAHKMDRYGDAWYGSPDDPRT